MAEMRILHPVYHDEGVPLEFVLTSGAGTGLYSVAFEAEELCADVPLEDAIGAMCEHSAAAAKAAG